MKVVAKSFGDPLRPPSGEVGPVALSGQLAAVLCKLARERWSGVVYAEHSDEGAVFSFRDGHVVQVEDLGDSQQSLPDALLERGLVSAEQYAEIAARVLDSLAENEDVAFCEDAVQHGILSQPQIDTELRRRVRGRVIQAVGWEDCRIELDADPDSLLGIAEYPEQVQPLVYTGVRTFYDEDRIRATLGTGGELYVRLTRPLAELKPMFGLEEHELGLLAALRPDAGAMQQIGDSSLDALEALQLLCTLALAGLLEFGGSPLSDESSGIRSTQAMAGRPGSQPRVPAAREGRGPSQQRLPMAREERTPSQAKMQALRERTPSQSRTPAVTPDSERSQPGAPSAQPGSPRRPSASGSRYSSSSMPAIRDEQLGRAAPTPRPSSMPAPAPAMRPPASEPATREVPASQAVQPQASPAQRRRPRKLSATLKRLDRELKQIRPHLTVPLEPLPPPPSAQPAKGNHAEQLLRMRQAQSQRTRETVEPETEDASTHFRAAMEAMRDQQFGRAHDAMRKACQAEPQNETYAMYCLWTRFRSGSLQEEGLAKLRLTLRERVSDEEHRAFAYYALGHIALADKKDETAEKCFRKAIEFDRNNKDATRHLRIIELRRKSADQAKSSKIFGIEIKSKKP